MFRAGSMFAAAALLALAPQPDLRAQGKCPQCTPNACAGNSEGKGNNGQGHAFGHDGGNGNGQGNAHAFGRNRNNGNSDGPQNCEPIDLTIETDINFGRLVLIGDGVGRVVIDLSSGNKATFGGIDDLGGMAVQGRAVITGTPNQVIRVNIPTSIIMNDPAGGQAELRDFVSDLPPLPMLDGNGQLTFNFSGSMYTDADAAIGGKLRGRIPISVQYD